MIQKETPREWNMSAAGSLEDGKMYHRLVHTHEGAAALFCLAELAPIYFRACMNQNDNNILFEHFVNVGQCTGM